MIISPDRVERSSDFARVRLNEDYIISRDELRAASLAEVYRASVRHHEKNRGGGDP